MISHTGLADLGSTRRPNFLMSNPTTIPISAIVEGDRARSSKKYGNLTTLADSIRSIGLIQPIVLSTRSDFRYDLVAGGRRFRALLSIGATELSHGVTLRVGTYGFIYENEVPEHARLEAELDENIHRLDMDWMDQVLLVDRVHKAKRAIHGGDWGQAQTAKLLGYDGLSSISMSLAAADLIRRGDHEVLKCQNLKEVNQLRLKRGEDAALAELQRRLAAKQGKTAAPVAAQEMNAPLSVGTSSFLDSFSVDLGGPKTTITPSATPLAGPQEPVTVPLTSMFLLGDSVKDVMPGMPDASFDHIVTDIPYGIDLENLDLKNQESVEKEHDVMENVALLLPFINQSYRLIKPGGFLVFCFDLDHWNYIQQLGKGAGFKVQDWPFIACKTSACRNNAPGYNTTKNYECVAFFRKDEKSVLRKPITTSWKPYDFAAERALYNNPFAKPFELWKDIFDAIAFPGQSILDPFAGECSSLRAAANCGLAPRGIEISPTHYNRGLENMKKVYALIHRSNVNFV